ncbi:MAG TPA: sigma-54-dependent Fis family transcriptional regulator [Thermoanaerobaculia bacterium]|nr:sigma-54-dependent Fis family transcriptional regulator [Thermoanaerobaculia bacterium]
MKYEVARAIQQDELDSERPSDLLVDALSRIARVVSGTLELREVFSRVAEIAATVLPFDFMAVMRVQSADALELYSLSGGVKDPPYTIRPEDFSPALRPLPDRVKRIDDFTESLDPDFPIDRKMRETGMRSSLTAPFLRGEQLAGYVMVESRRPGAFTAGHEAVLQPIADFLGLALEHERLWSLEASRRRRLDAVDALLPIMANVLDIREIFNQVSAVVKPVLPHDLMVLSSLSADRRVMNVDALSGEPAPELWAPMPVREGDLKHAIEPVLIPDSEAEAETEPERCRKCRSLGARALLKMPLRLDGGFIGALIFISKTPGQYSEEDIVVARRVGDHVSLALSHQRLAEEQRQAAEARERASLLEERVMALREELDATRGYHRVLGESKKWKDVLTQGAKVAPTETTVLLTGESGTGKEVVARFLHRGSRRADGPFVALNCAALPETLLESELFGHERGAFTGALTSRPGRLEQAAGGVLFLDEVGEMSPAVQAKLLRVLQEREFQRLGGTRPIKADVRVIAATNRDLAAALASGGFREDLYYRLSVFEIRLPPLRERPEDILPIAEAFLEEVGPAVGRPAAGISRQAHEALLSYPWPGNVRELRNALERATILCDGGLITLEHLPISVGSPSHPAALPPQDAPEAFPPGGIHLDAVERDLIAKALREAENNRSRAARLLGITRSQLYSRMQKYGLAEG